MKIKHISSSLNFENFIVHILLQITLIILMKEKIYMHTAVNICCDCRFVRVISSYILEKKKKN